MLVMLVAAAKIFAVKAGTSIEMAHLLVRLPVLFAPATNALVLLKWIFLQTNMPSSND
jgi:hypothetical protein